MTDIVIDVGNFSHISPTPFIQTSLQIPSQRHVSTQHNSLMVCHHDPESAGLIEVLCSLQAVTGFHCITMFTLIFKFI